MRIEALGRRHSGCGRSGVAQAVEAGGLQGHAAHEIGHRQPAESARRLLGAYAKSEPAPPIDRGLLSRYAAIEVMRRLIGVAQLPIPGTRRLRSSLLERSRGAMLDGELDVLFE